MSFFQGLIESLGSLFTDSSSSAFDSRKNSENQAMEGVATGNERTAVKLKGYFDLAKEEIAKAVRAEEWGLVDDAILHYQNAQRILVEAASTPVPSHISFSEQGKVKSYQQKISKWQGQVSERLQTLSRRAGSRYTNKKTLPQAQPAAVSSTTSGARKEALQKSSGLSGHSNAVMNTSSKIVSSKPIQESGGYDAKLVEMINSVIVDRSPSVKWEDIGRDYNTSSSSSSYYYYYY
ncbi:unnamed protein product [Ilex paraguariensis]|uniref:MIT domain-containing protein n=1 Tax=Ilex paraguariensis TaxID=185542 RepID=A0ABC8UZH8_9AQUA